MIRVGRLAVAPLLLTIIVAGGPSVMAQTVTTSPGPSGDPGAAPASGDPGVAAVMTITDGDGFTGSYAYGAATGPDGSVVIVGEHIGPDPAVPAKAAAWRSVDAAAWTEVALPKSAHARSMAVAASAGGWAAVGVVPGGNGLIWTSPDGIEWTRAKPLKRGEPQAIIATPDGFLAGGKSNVKGVDHPVLWYSGEGASWRSVKLPGKGQVTSVAQLPDGTTLALVQSVTTTDEGTHVSYRYLRSVDGTAWDRIDLLAAGPSIEVLNAAELGVVGDRFVQVLDGGPAAGPFVGSIRTSTDGVTWQDAWTAAGPLFAVAGGAIVNVFGQGGQVGSPDGIAWSEVARPEITVTFGATGLPDGRSVVLGNTFGDTPSVVVHVVPPVVDTVPPVSPTSSAAPTASVAP